MPRSFLVKKVKLDTFSSADLESSYGRARSDLGERLQEKGVSWDEAGGGEGPRAGPERVEGQSVGLQGAGAPGNRPEGTRTSRRQWLERDLEGMEMGGRERGRQR